jgi:hypothetical protein
MVGGRWHYDRGSDAAKHGIGHAYSLVQLLCGNVGDPL